MPSFLVSPALWLALLLPPVLGSEQAVRETPCEEMQPVRCGGSPAWHQQLTSRGRGQLAGSGRLCRRSVCEEVTVYFDSGWKATDIAVHSFLVNAFALEANEGDSVKGSLDEDLSTFETNLKLSLFFFDKADHKHALTEWARSVSGLPPSLERVLLPRFVVVGPGFMQKVRMVIHFHLEGAAVIKQCSPTFDDVLRQYGSYRDELDDSLCREGKHEL
mmetsp:Transcript_9445/g.20500  ORF Transcript_9445/g.20500 Transcript_9445/m.20500 type:complete len:217 (+) Transcript_9445:100-750(+)